MRWTCAECQAEMDASTESVCYYCWQEARAEETSCGADNEDYEPDSE